MKTKIHNQEFKTKNDAYVHVRALLKSLNNTTVGADHDQFPFLCELIKRHCCYLEKVGCGVKAFRIVVNNTYNKGTSHLEIIRTDGTMIDISWVMCCRQTKPRPVKFYLNRAMRHAIELQILSFKTEYKKQHPYVCAICSATDAVFHVDHHKPQFSDLTKDFVQKYPNHPTTFARKPLSKGHDVFHTEDKQYEENWSKYHKAKANLRILCARCNLTRPKATLTSAERYYQKNRATMIEKTRQAQKRAVVNKKYFCTTCDKNYSSLASLKRHYTTMLHRNNSPA